MSKPHRLPPLNSLRAFEAAARHESFTDAAAELSVTPNAISHQVKKLEQHLGKPLFERSSRALLLTEEGRNLLPGVSAAFDTLRIAATQVTHPERRRTVAVSAPAAFAIGWILPRLQRFHLENPSIELLLSTARLPLDLESEGLDADIRHGRGDWPGNTSDYVFGDALLPVCSPSYLSARPLVQTSRALLGEMLLLSTTAPNDWTDWFAHVGVPRTNVSPRVLNFGNSTLPIQAAIRGLGFALADVNLIEDELRETRLVAPVGDPKMVRGTAWYLCFRPDNETSSLAAFRTWIQREARRV